MLLPRPGRIPELRNADQPDARPGSPAELATLLRSASRTLVLTGAGCSTGSGMPTYRDPSGQWLRRSPIFYQDFLKRPEARRRYWARSFFGWRAMQQAHPGPAHHALAAMGRHGRVGTVVTQNVDGLHQRADQPQVIELHGSLRAVGCLDCNARTDRDLVQQRLAALNPDWSAPILELRPDGDAELDEQAWPGFRVADCEACGGTLKPDVVFFGESVPRGRSERIDAALNAADALLLVGTSAVVWSGFRLVRQAAARGLPIAAVNDGRTRADPLLRFKIGGDCGLALRAVAHELGLDPAPAGAESAANVTGSADGRGAD